MDLGEAKKRLLFIGKQRLVDKPYTRANFEQEIKKPLGDFHIALLTMSSEPDAGDGVFSGDWDELDRKLVELIDEWAAENPEPTITPLPLIKPRSQQNNPKRDLMIAKYGEAGADAYFAEEARQAAIAHSNARQQSSAYVLSKEEADALRRCVQILASSSTPQDRGQMALNVETWAREKAPLLAFHLKDVATLFYPNSPVKAADFLQKLTIAHERGDLQSALPKGEQGVFMSDLAAWPECPPVPADSPLKYWLPVEIQSAQSREKPQQSTPAAAPVARFSAQETAILTAIKNLGNEPLKLPPNSAGKPGVRAAVWETVSSRKDIFVSKKAFELAWQRALDNSRIAYASDTDAPTLKIDG